mmetsp:Transcript_2193/g.6930  ORF Transcript_2193/g.6930 Transcript_2193/m.6930 type:complete len:252 (-) Transcript_2193:231-986(-)
MEHRSDGSLTMTEDCVECASAWSWNDQQPSTTVHLRTRATSSSAPAARAASAAASTTDRGTVVTDASGALSTCTPSACCRSASATAGVRGKRTAIRCAGTVGIASPSAVIISSPGSASRVCVPADTRTPRATNDAAVRSKRRTSTCGGAELRCTTSAPSSSHSAKVSTVRLSGLAASAAAATMAAASSDKPTLSSALPPNNMRPSVVAISSPSSDPSGRTKDGCSGVGSMLRLPSDALCLSSAAVSIVTGV